MLVNIIFVKSTNCLKIMSNIKDEWNTQPRRENLACGNKKGILHCYSKTHSFHLGYPVMPIKFECVVYFDSIDYHSLNIAKPYQML